jgi:hypothetical protein
MVKRILDDIDSGRVKMTRYRNVGEYLAALDRRSKEWL